MEKKGKFKGSKKHNYREKMDRELFLKDPDTLYGIVEKALGMSRYHVFCFDDVKKRVCKLKGSLKGLRIEVGDIVIVGMRDFSTNDDKGDIIYKYTEKEVKQLKEMEKIPKNIANEFSDIDYEIAEATFDFDSI